jgi:hypothetical protein
MDRLKELIARITKALEEEGIEVEPIFEHSKNGFGDFQSFFELMIDVRLDGKDKLDAQEVWENMKKQLNWLQTAAIVASDDYRKLENRFRNLQNDYQLLIKENPTTKPKTDSES